MPKRGPTQHAPWAVTVLLLAFTLDAPAQDLPDLIKNPPPPPRPSDFFLRGDSNADHNLELADAIHSLSYLFTGGPQPPCLKTADTNDDGLIDITDPIALLQFLFVGGPSPHSPFADCGVDLVEDGLGCAVYSFCPLESLHLHKFKVIDRRFDCVPETFCNQFLAKSLDPGGPGDIPITDLDVRFFFDSPPTAEEEAQTVAFVLAPNREALGFLQAGPVTPSGVGTTLVVLSTSIFIAKPDLMVSSFTGGRITPSALGGGFDLEISIEVRNRGAMPTGAFTVAVVRELYRGTFLSYTVESLDPDETNVHSATIHFPQNLGTLTLRAVADYHDDVRESDEENNANEVTVQFPRS